MKKIHLLSVALLATLCCHAQGFETFTNSPLGGTYASGDFEGDNNVNWTYVACKEGKDDSNSSSVNFPGIMLDSESNGGAISFNSGLNGVGEITMKLFRGLSPTTMRKVDLYVNGGLITTSIGFNDSSEHVFTVTNINASGNVLIEIKNSTSAQIKIDDIQWSAFGTALSVAKNEIEGFSLYPNPVVNGRFKINSISGADKLIEIYSMLGKQVYSENVQQDEIVDVSSLKSGIYMLEVKQEGNISRRKLFIE